MTAASLRRLASTLAVFALVFLALPSMSATKWFLTGYVQGRFGDIFSAVPPRPGDPLQQESFDATRAYIFLKASVDEHVSAVILANGFMADKTASPNTPQTVGVDVNLLEAYAEYTAAPYSARLGLSRIPFGYETQLTTSRLITLERSQIIGTLAYPYGFDRGGFIYYQPAKGLNVSAGVVNGSPVNVQPINNQAGNFAHKNVVARVGCNIKGGQAGGSIYYGDKPGAIGTRLQLLNFDLQTTRGNWTAITEVLGGREGANHPIGGYLTLAYQKPKAASQPYVRVEMFDRDRGSSNDLSKRLTLGYNYYLNPTTKLTVEFQDLQDDMRTDLHTSQAVQYQVVF
ncbi:MAG: hypothetical protein ACYDBB_08495 [Armatimonadota bacterium]